MLDFMYTDIITIKIAEAQDAYGNCSYTPTTIKGCLQPKTKQRIDGNGRIVTTNCLLHTKTEILKSSKIVYQGEDRQIDMIYPVTNHLTGRFDHYEVTF